MGRVEDLRAQMEADAAHREAERAAAQEAAEKSEELKTLRKWFNHPETQRLIRQYYEEKSSYQVRKDGRKSDRYTRIGSVSWIKPSFENACRSWEHVSPGSIAVGISIPISGHYREEVDWEEDDVRYLSIQLRWLEKPYTTFAANERSRTEAAGYCLKVGDKSFIPSDSGEIEDFLNALARLSI